MTCNIDQTGRMLRAASGTLCFVAAIVAWHYDMKWVAAGLLAAALFQFFEALKGWCVMRALGFRTKY